MKETDGGAQLLSIPSEGLSLEAVLHVPLGLQPPGLLVVCHPHPLYGGSMDNNVVAALCESALQEGMAALRFNFRGVGASGGSHDNGEGEQLDVLAALVFAADLPGGRSIGLAGYSFGAATAAAGCRRASALPQALVLVSPPLRTPDPARYQAGPSRRLFLTGDSDAVCPRQTLEALAEEITPPAICSVVEGADHSWFGYETELRDIVAGFLRWNLAQT
jgi:alpha/beta superfamily hydrolase